MPSSSTRDTSQEIRLLNLYHSVYVRLYFSGRHKEANFITNTFAGVLDYNVRELVDTLMVDNRTWFSDWRAHAATKKRADLVWAAGSYMADAGAALFEFGRFEAPNICALADEIYDLAQQICG